MLPYARAGISKNQVEELIDAITAEDVGAIPDNHTDDGHVPFYNGGWGSIAAGELGKPVLASVDPTENDNSGDGYTDGRIWINQTENTSFILLDAAMGYWRRL